MTAMSNLFNNPQPAKPVELYYYQQEAIDVCYGFLRTRKDNPCIVIPTGGGKTPLMATICNDAVTRWNGRVLVLSHVKELVSQTAETLGSWYPKLKVGVYSAGLGRRESRADVLVAGIQSVYKKGLKLAGSDPFRLVLVDESHRIPTSGDGMYRQLLTDLQVAFPGVRVVGLTATPYRLKGGSVCGPENFLNEICYEAGVRELIAKGYLCRLTSKQSRHSVDSTKLAIKNGEFDSDALSLAFDTDGIVNQAVGEILHETRNRKSVLIFCCNVAHAEHVQQLIESQAGQQVGLITGETADSQRDLEVNRFKDGQLKFLVNVNVFCLDENTEILTSAGWVGIDEISESHRVANWDDGRIFFEQPQEIFRRSLDPVNESFCSLKSNGIDIRVTNNHTMVEYFGGGQTKWRKTTAQQLVGKNAMLPCHGMADPFMTEPQSQSISKKRRASRIRSLSFVYRKRDSMNEQEAKDCAVIEVDRRLGMFVPKQTSDLSLDECKLIGFWLGDGSVCKTWAGSTQYSVSQSLRYPDNVEWIRKTLDACSIEYTESHSPAKERKPYDSINWMICRGTGSGVQAKKGIVKLEPYLKKEGTDLWWGFTREQLIAFLDGYHLADGIHHGDSVKGLNVHRVCSVRKNTLDLIQAIATCRGIRTVVTKLSLPRKQNHKQQWSLSWNLNAKKISTFKNRFSIEPNPMPERVWCVKSTSGFIITRRNGCVAVVGNCEGFDARRVDCVVLLRSTLSPGLYYQMVGRGLRLHETKSDCLILDFGGNVMRHGCIDAIKVQGDKAKGGSGAEAAAKECPECESMVPVVYKTCPECGFPWPIEERKPNHQPTADAVAVTTDQLKPSVWNVNRVYYCEHEKRGFKEGDLRTMRVSYYQDRVLVAEEWVCVEHSGWANERALSWWNERTLAPMPATSQEAAKLATLGYLAEPTQIEIVKPPGEKFSRITKYWLGPKVDPDEVLIEVDEWGAEVRAGSVVSDEEIPF
jgi:superfamily II DNA or RNA helicase